MTHAGRRCRKVALLGATCCASHGGYRQRGGPPPAHVIAAVKLKREATRLLRLNGYEWLLEERLYRAASSRERWELAMASSDTGEMLLAMRRLELKLKGRGLDV